MLETGRLQSYIRNTLVPTYRKRYYALMSAIDKHLIPLGFKIEAKTATTSSTIPGTAGGYFTYLRLVSDLPVAKTVAAIALRDFALRVAFGHMFVVCGDQGSVARAEADGGFAQCIRLCWAWHEDTQIAEGIERLAEVVLDIRARMARGEDVGKGLEIGIR
jgi:DNA-binding transcriptional MocR family regulator